MATPYARQARVDDYGSYWGPVPGGTCVNFEWLPINLVAGISRSGYAFLGY
jgi:hypothetical protein